jgi:hypothetical protein
VTENKREFGRLGLVPASITSWVETQPTSLIAVFQAQPCKGFGNVQQNEIDPSKE